MKLPILVCLAALWAFPAQAENLGYRGTGKSSLGYESYEEALAAKRRDPSFSMKKEKGWLVFTSEGAFEIWSFTPEGHYAYPSFSKRKMVRTGNGWGVTTNMQCGAEKPVCDRLMREYRDLDKRMKDYNAARQTGK